jgi:riboflavin biosynthesis pyrimidine reductase
MVATADGHATLAGRSAPLSSSADRALFHALRASVDAVLVGAATVRIERYGPLIRDVPTRALRRERGLAEEPLACVVSGRLQLDSSIPLLADPGARLVVVTPSPGQIGPAAAAVQYIRAVRDGELDLAAALARLAREQGVALLLCEGGPRLAAQLVAAGLLDELYLSVSPQLAGGDPAGTATPRILGGAGLDPTVQLALLGALESDSHLFLRYGVVAPERVSRETISSSSEAS